MKIDKSKLEFVPVPQNLPLVNHKRNMYALINGKLHFYHYSCSIDEFQDERIVFSYDEIEGVVGEDEKNINAGSFYNIIELGEIIRQKSNKYRYFLNHKYDVIYKLKGYMNLSEFKLSWGYSIERFLFLAFNNYFIQTGVCDMEDEEKACSIDLENNQFIIKMQTSTLELLDFYLQKFEFLSDFIITTEIKERNNNKLQL